MEPSPSLRPLDSEAWLRDFANNYLNDIPIEQEADFGIVAEALRSLTDPERNHKVPEKLAGRIKSIKEILESPEKFVNVKAEDQAKFKQALLQKITSKIDILTSRPIIKWYDPFKKVKSETWHKDLANEYLEKIKFEQESDFESVAEALKSLIDPENEHKVPENLKRHIEAIKEVLDSPEELRYVKKGKSGTPEAIQNKFEQDVAQFRQAILNQVALKIKILSNLSPNEKQQILAEQNLLREKAAKAQAQIAVARPPAPGSSARTESEQAVIDRLQPLIAVLEAQRTMQRERQALATQLEGLLLATMNTSSNPDPQALEQIRSRMQEIDTRMIELQERINQETLQRATEQQSADNVIFRLISLFANQQNREDLLNAILRLTQFGGIAVDSSLPPPPELLSSLQRGMTGTRWGAPIAPPPAPGTTASEEEVEVEQEMEQEVALPNIPPDLELQELRQRLQTLMRTSPGNDPQIQENIDELRARIEVLRRRQEYGPLPQEYNPLPYGLGQGARNVAGVQPQMSEDIYSIFSFDAFTNPPAPPPIVPQQTGTAAFESTRESIRRIPAELQNDIVLLSTDFALVQESQRRALERGLVFTRPPQSVMDDLASRRQALRTRLHELNLNPQTLGNLSRVFPFLFL